MPRLMRLFGFSIYFWSNENKPLEPVHVHVSKRQHENATKIWILSDGRAQVEYVDSEINRNELKKVLGAIELFSDDIILKWEEFFGEKASFYDLENDIDLDDELER